MSARGLELTLPASAENVAIARHAVAGLAEAVDMEPPAVADLKTVVTEACMNVVVHAYDDGERGPLDVTAYPEDGHLVVIVRDRGAGIRPRADAARQSLRLGLPLIAALSSSFEISGSPGRGTEVTMRMALRPGSNGAEPDVPAPGAVRATRMTMPAGELLGPVLARVLSILAARANFSVDRLSDAMLLGDAISAQAPGSFPDETARIEVEDSEGGLRVRIGPLVEGAGDRVLSGMRIPEIGGSLERLADEIRVEHRDGDECLLIRIAPAG